MFSFLFFLTITLPNLAQIPLTWEMLEKVTYESVRREGPMWYYGKAAFDASLEQLRGQRVRIKGYVLPIDETGGVAVLSRYPYAMCFFCGAAGQESVMELVLAKPQKFKMDVLAEFEGVLELDNQELSLNYRLLQAKPIAK